MSDVGKTVYAIQGNAVKREILSVNEDGYVLTWDSGENNWESKAIPSPTIPTSLPPDGPAGGGLSGTYPNPTVISINGINVSGIPSAGQVLTATDATDATWQTPSVGTLSGDVIGSLGSNIVQSLTGAIGNSYPIEVTYQPTTITSLIQTINSYINEFRFNAGANGIFSNWPLNAPQAYQSSIQCGAIPTIQQSSFSFTAGSPNQNDACYIQGTLSDRSGTQRTIDMAVGFGGGGEQAQLNLISTSDTPSLISIVASNFNMNGTVVHMSTPPSAGQILTASDPYNASWQSPSFQYPQSAITLSTGTVTLSSGQQLTPSLVLTGTLTGDITIDFGGVIGYYLCDFSAVALSGFDISLINGSTTTIITSLITPFKTLVIVMLNSVNTLSAG
jgi:hypothetical protein